MDASIVSHALDSSIIVIALQSGKQIYINLCSELKEVTLSILLNKLTAPCLPLLLLTGPQNLLPLNGGQEVSILLKYTTIYVLDSFSMPKNSHSKLELVGEALEKCTLSNQHFSIAVDKVL